MEQGRGQGPGRDKVLHLGQGHGRIMQGGSAARRGKEEQEVDEEKEDCRTLMTKLLFQLLSTVVNANFMQIFFGWRATLKCHYGQ